MRSDQLSKEPLLRFYAAPAPFRYGVSVRLSLSAPLPMLFITRFITDSCAGVGKRRASLLRLLPWKLRLVRLVLTAGGVG
jgi:hypothetical protein